MASLSPLVLEGYSSPDFIQYILNKHTTSSTLIVCVAKEDFIAHLTAALVAPPALESVASNTEGKPERDAQRHQTWTSPTLRLLASSRTVNVVFCPELAHLRAYLATFTFRKAKELEITLDQSQPPRNASLLGILNLLDLHRPTSAYSAQGLNRTLAIAIEAAHHSGSRLLLAECGSLGLPSLEPPIASEDLEEPGVRAAESDLSPWDEEVSILNVTTKSFGAGQRGWVGRTVSVRRIAGRWCRFESRETL